MAVRPKRVLLAMSIGAAAAAVLFVVALTLPTMIGVPTAVVLGFGIARLDLKLDRMRTTREKP